jgi:hypothetical protein
VVEYLRPPYPFDPSIQNMDCTVTSFVNQLELLNVPKALVSFSETFSG